MSEVRLYASHPDFRKFDFMQRLLLIVTNPHMFFNVHVIIQEPERLALVEMIKGEIEKVMDEYEYLPPNIAEIINKLEDGLIEEDEE